MADLKEQRVCIKFCFGLGKTAVETVTLIRGDFKEEVLSQARVYKWVCRFKCVTCHLKNNRDLDVLQQA